jgi:hypothetical protein
MSDELAHHQRQLVPDNPSVEQLVQDLDPVGG